MSISPFRPDTDPSRRENAFVKSNLLRLIWFNGWNVALPRGLLLQDCNHDSSESFALHRRAEMARGGCVWVERLVSQCESRDELGTMMKDFLALNGRKKTFLWPKCKVGAVGEWYRKVGLPAMSCCATSECKLLLPLIPSISVACIIAKVQQLLIPSLPQPPTSP